MTKKCTNCGLTTGVLEYCPRSGCTQLKQFHEETPANICVCTVVPANSSFFGAETTKCAEIHYYTSNFTIKCASCQEIFISSYHDFTRHFQAKHLDSERNGVSVKEDNEWIMIDAVVEEVDDETDDQKCSDEDQTSQNDSIFLKYASDKVFESCKNTNTTTETEEDIPNEIDWTQAYTPDLLNRNKKRPYKPRNQPNLCNYCGKTFRRRYQLDTHLNIHTGLKPHQCDVCGRQFRAINTLQRHLNTHGRRETFTCKYCSKEFTHKAAYVSHETRHTQERHVPCDDCGKIFYTHNQLDTHKRKMHHNLNDDDLPYVCDLCPKRYRTASMLCTHKLKKHYRTAKYFCEQCGKKFVDTGQLNNHMGVHEIKDGMTT